MKYGEIIKKVNRIGKRKGGVFAFIELQHMLKKHRVKMPRDEADQSKGITTAKKKGAQR